MFYFARSVINIFIVLVDKIFESTNIRGRSYEVLKDYKDKADTDLWSRELKE